MKLAIKKLVNQICMPASREEDRVRRVDRLLAHAHTDFRQIVLLESAIASIPDGRQREAMASYFWRWFDLLRIFAAGATPPKRGAAFLVAVPFTVKSLDEILTAGVINTLVEPIEPAFSFDASDPNYPGHKAYVVAAPMINISAVEMFCLNFMLANSHMDTPVDNLYAEMWYHHLQTPAYATGPYAFIFPAVMPGVSFDEALLGAQLDSGSSWLQYGIDVILKHVDALNRRYPTLGIEMGPVSRLSDALFQGTRFRLSTLMQTLVEQAGRQVWTPDVGGTFDPTLFGDIVGQLPEFREGAAHLPEPIHTVVLGASSFVPGEGGGGRQLGQITAYGLNGQFLVAIAPVMALGFPVAAMAEVWREVAGADSNEPTLLESVAIDQPPVTPEGQSMYRDANGEWRERELLEYGESGRVLKYATWERAIAASSFRVVAQEQQTTLSLLNEPKISDLFAARYRADVASRFKDLATRPGITYKTALYELMGEWPEFGVLHMKSPEESFPPRGLWCVYHHRVAKGAIFRVTSALVTMMTHTDIGEGFPASYLHAPFPDSYFHFEGPLHIPAVGSGPAADLTGFFVSEKAVDAADQPGDDGTQSRILSFTFIVENEKEPYSFAQGGFEFRVVDGKEDRDFYAQMHDSLHLVAPDVTGPLNDEDRERAVGTVLSHVMLAAKILVYTTLRNARLVHRAEKTQLVELAKTQTGSARQKTALRAAMALDFIEIGPETIDAPSKGSDSDLSMPVRWRHGHVWNQAYGPQWSLRRPRWRKPVLVNAALLGDNEPPPPPSEYKVR